MPLLSSKPVNFEHTWKELEEALIPIITDVSSGLKNDQWMGLYTGVYRVCTNPINPQPQQLYFRLKRMLEKHCMKIRDELSAVRSETDLLRHYCSTFHHYSTGMTYGGELFAYLNRYWIRTSHSENGQTPIPGVYPVVELSLHVWRDVVFFSLRERLQAGFVSLMNGARESGRDTFEDSGLVLTLAESYLKLGLNKHDPLKLYREELENAFLKQTNEYYAREAGRALEESSVAVYLVMVEERLHEETARCSRCLPKSTVKRVREECEMVMIEKHAERLCTDAQMYLEEGRHADIQRLFHLLSLRDENVGLALLKNVVKKHIEAAGVSVVKEFTEEDAAKNPAAYMDAILRVYKQFNGLITSVFGTHPLFRTAFDQACRTFVNMRQRTPELLARYAHSILDKSGGPPRTPCSTPRAALRNTMEEGEIERAVEGVTIIFRFLDDKDIFKHYYSKYFAKRLIHDTSVSDDLEELTLRNLRETCGYDYVSKLHRMFTDKRLSAEVTEQFLRWIADGGRVLPAPNANSIPIPPNAIPAGGVPPPPASNALPSGILPPSAPIVSMSSSSASSATMSVTAPLPMPAQASGAALERAPLSASSTVTRSLGGIDFSILVLTAGSWPLQTPSSEFKPPSALRHCISSFCDFYHAKHNGRKLYWLYHQSRGDLKANCFNRKYEFHVTTYQMAILLLFNDSDKVSASEICQKTDMKLEDVALHALPLVKAKVLTATQANSSPQTLLPTDTFEVNSDYSSKRNRIKISSAVAVETHQEVSTSKKEIVEDRKMVVQAAIVRIMKARRQLEHNQLVGEVIKQLSRTFKPSVQQIKQNIEILIDKEYIQRVDAHVQTYVYVV